jgi:hypothetical protein
MKLISTSNLFKYCILLILVILSFQASAQQGLINLKMDKRPLSQFFQEIQSQCKYNIIYSDEVVSDTMLVSAHFDKRPLIKALDSVLSSKQLFYQLVSDNMIVIGSLKLLKIDNESPKTLLSGEVVSSTNQPVPFATISLLEDGIQKSGAVSNETGYFEFSYEFKVGKTYALKISSLAYKTLTLKFLAPKTEHFKSFGKLQLVPEVKALKEVTVNGGGKLIEMNGGSIIFNVSKSITAQGSNALELLSRAPGVSVGSDNSISLNGKSGAAILIDGKLTYLSGTEISELLKSMPSSDIKAIEIMNSPGAKYDASGTAGIINLKTQKSLSKGFNLAFTSGLNYGVYLKNNQDIAFTFRKDRLNIFGNYNHFIGNYSYLYGGDRIQEGKFYNSFTDDVDKRKKIGSRLGADFSIDKKQTIGLLLNGNFLFGGGITDTRTEIGNASGLQVDQVLTAINDYYYQQTQRYNVNLNYKYEDSLGRILTFDADYGDFMKGSGNLQSNRYTAINNTVLSDNLYRSLNAIDIGLKAVKIDYAANLWKGKIETGIRYSSVKADNDSKFLEIRSGTESLDPSRSNHFIYTENIKSAYLNYKKDMGKWQFEGGLRVENSSSSGKLNDGQTLSGGQSNDRNYTNLFPSASVSFKPSASHSFSLSYTERIDRPAYQSLNPFIYLLDELSFWQGNPFLQPQLSYKGLLQYAYKSSTIVGLSYAYIDNFSVEVTDTANKTGIVMIPRNVGVQRHIALSLSQTLKPYTWWDINFNGTLFRLDNDIDFGKGRVYQPKQTAVRFGLQQNFKLPYSLNGEISGVFNSKRLVGANQFLGSTSQVDLGLQRNLLGQRATLRLIFSDIYKGTKGNSIQSIDGLYIRNYSYFEARQIKINFSYRFGSGNSKNPANRSSALENENGRIK